MSRVLPIGVTINVKGERFPLKFAQDVASSLKPSDRVDYEVRNDGLLVKGIWEYDLELVIDEIRKITGKNLIISKINIEYIKGNPTLEPIMELSITTPEEFMAAVLGDINKRRGLILAMDDIDGKKTITAKVPLAELFGYMSSLKRIAQIEWVVNVEFYDYEPAPYPKDPNPNEPASQALRV